MIENAVITTIEKYILLVVESGASELALAASLNQAGRSVAFFSGTLPHSEQKWHSVEKDASDIVNALQKWRYFLLSLVFQMITDHQPLSYMYD